MIGLFDKDGKGKEEVRSHLPYFDANQNFDKIEPYVERQFNELRDLISPTLYDRARQHYLSASYKVEDQQDATLQKLDRLVYLLQSPAAILGYLEFSPGNDIIHSKNGRRVHWDADSKPAAQWQIDAMEESEFRSGQKAIDVLLSFIEEERETFTEWKNSEVRGEMRELFINSIKEWPSVHPLADSRWLYVKCLPFFRKYQNGAIASAVGPLDLAALLTKRKTNAELLPADVTLLKLIQEPLGLHVLGRAIRELPFRMLPKGLVQNYTGDRLSTRANQVPSRVDQLEVAAELERRGEIAYRSLQQHIQSLNPIEETSNDEDPCDDKFFLT